MSDKKNFLYTFFPSRGDSRTEKIRKIIVITASVILMISIFILVSYFIDQARTKQINDRLAENHASFSVITKMTALPSETESETEPAPPPPLVLLDSMAPILAENPDTAGWIKIPNTNVDNAVMQCDNNEYYVDRNFYGEKSQAGTIFADYRCVVNDYSDRQHDNIILYGHNQKDSTMFGTLKKYKVTQQNTGNFQFYLDNPTFTFSNLYEEYTYKIIALFIIEVEPYQTRDGIIFDYHNYINFSSKVRPFDAFKENLLARTAVDTGVDFNIDDKYITLSTCSNEFEPSRFVVVGRRVREGEDPDVDTSKAVLNTDATEPDLNYIYSR